MINERRLDEAEGRLAEGFTDDSRRSLYSFALDRDQFIDGLKVMADQGLLARSLGVVATAGDFAVLHRWELHGHDTASSFLMITVFDADGNLARMIDFDEDRVDDALAELALVTGEPVTLLPPATSQF